jgi:hypothetical protein
MRRTPHQVQGILPGPGLIWRPLLERWLCPQCVLGAHRQCEALGCECACHDDPWQPRKPGKHKTRKPHNQKETTS